MKSTGQTRQLITRSALSWVVGTLIAFSGTAMVRLVPPAHYLLHTIGFLVAGAGLFTIAIGVHHRTKRE